MADFTNQPLPPPPPPGPPRQSPPQYPAQYPPQYPGQYPPQYPQYPQGAYPPQMAYPFARPSRTSGLAIASMVLGILWLYWIGSILAVIFGHIAINQASKDPSITGKGMAIAGLVLGYIGVAFLALIILVAAATSV